MMKKVLMIAAIVVVVVILGVVFALGYFGILPSVSKLIGTDQPRDLGVTYTQEDLDNAFKNSKTKPKVSEKVSEPAKSINTSGQKSVEFEINSSELTAVMNHYSDNWGNYPAENLQMKLNNDGTGELSGSARVDKIISYIQATGSNYSEADIQTALDYLRISRRDSLPFYITFDGAVAKNSVTELSFDKIEVGRFGVPNNLIEQYIGEVETFIEAQIKSFKGLDISEATIGEGVIEFKGKVPENISVTK